MMHYYKIRAGMYAAHREDPSKSNPHPEVSQLGYVQRDGKEWYAYTPNGVEIEGSRGTTEAHARKALEKHAIVTVLRATR